MIDFLDDCVDEVIPSGGDALELYLAEKCAEYYADPYGWVMWAYDWGHGDLAGQEGPDTWQREILEALGREIRARGFDGKNSVTPIRMAIASGHGIGKSALTAWLIMFIQSTRYEAKGTVTANTGDQLGAKTWAELGKWRRLCLTGHWFEYNNSKGSRSLYAPANAEYWRVDGQTCREENSEAFAGQHRAGSTSYYIFDEASAIPESIWEVAEGGLTDGEPMFFAFGNPTQNSGAFRKKFSSRRWITRKIDSRTAKMTNKVLIQQWVDDYGEDSDFVRVRVRGEFPKSGDLQYIPSDLFQLARKRTVPLYDGYQPLICGVDLARGGGDMCYIQFRQGWDARSRIVYQIPGEVSRNSMVVISKLAHLFSVCRPDYIMVDEGGLGGPMADRLVQLGWPAYGVNFGGNADEHKHFKNKTSEMAARLLAWLRGAACVKDEDELEEDLCGREFVHDDKDRLCLESKRLFKKRLHRSPDWGDALLLTFAMDVPMLAQPRDARDYASPIAAQLAANTQQLPQDLYESRRTAPYDPDPLDDY